VRAVTSGARALASVELTPPDLVLLDIRMPDMDGYAVCEQLKATPKTADIPVLFISALDDVQDKMKAFAAGGVDYITKPFQLEEVMARVQTHLALRQLQRNLQAAHDRMAQELALAAQVQASFMHKTLPEIPGWQLAVALVPTRLTSGDFYDTVVLPDGSFGLLIADVMDKGVGAALYMAMSSALLRAYALEHPHHPELVCQAVNARLLEYTTADQFLTVFLGMLDPASNTLVYANAGHNPPLLLSPSGQAAPQLLKRTGAPLGMLEDAAWRLQQVQLQPGDCLVLYTDGVTEAASANDESFGLERLRCVVQEQAGQPATGVREAILAAVQEFTAGVQLTDDIALIVLVRDQAEIFAARTTRHDRIPT
jgi:serine phosphatase RsbU (regulator of sigma subunit)